MYHKEKIIFFKYIYLKIIGLVNEDQLKVSKILKTSIKKLTKFLQLKVF